MAESKSTKIAFVTTCKGRLEHLKQTLPRNLADNAAFKDAVFVVLDYDSPDDLQPYLTHTHASDIASGRLVVYRYQNGGKPFAMAHSKNMAARCGMLEGADILVTLDADNFTGPNFAQFVADAFKEPGVLPGIFLCPNYLHIKSLPHGVNRPVRGYAGRLSVWASTFLKVGGYDEIYNTWRGEDIDMNFRLQRMGYSMRYIPNQYLNAIPHSGDVRFKEWPHARQYEGKWEMENIRARTQTVVNYGKIGCGMVSRNGLPPIELKPLPTRIFGVGLQKTATTSLHHALQILGFDSFHWGEGEAPLIWYEMASLNRSPTLEKYYALSDNPIPLLYEKLDKAYPGSKFILTIRDEVDWLGSVKRLWDYRHNPTRALWDVYPFSNTIHTALYGTKDFDALAMLRRYRQHNREIPYYFRDRPHDLLILNMDSGEQWKSLCDFLDVPIPAGAYPRRNARRKWHVET
jgi:hypothetical protein